LYLAEVYWDLEWTLQQQGFDFTYDKRLLDRLHGVAAGDVRAHLNAEPAYADRLARFLENHDEPRSAVQLGPRLPAAATMLATLPGMRFFFDGQTAGARHRAPVQLGRWPDEAVSPEIVRLYGLLLNVADENLFHDGRWDLLQVGGAGCHQDDLIAWRWRHADRFAIVVVNLGAHVSEGHVQLSGLPSGNAWILEDRLSGACYGRDRASLEARGLYVRLEPGRAHILMPRS
jgi:hypothetical protein